MGIFFWWTSFLDHTLIDAYGGVRKNCVQALSSVCMYMYIKKCMQVFSKCKGYKLLQTLWLFVVCMPPLVAKAWGSKSNCPWSFIAAFKHSFERWCRWATGKQLIANGYGNGNCTLLVPYQLLDLGCLFYASLLTLLWAELMLFLFFHLTAILPASMSFVEFDSAL